MQEMKPLRAAVALVPAMLTLSACAGSHKATASIRDYVVPQNLKATGALGVPRPPGFRAYWMYPKGTRPPAIGVAFTDFRPKAGPKKAFDKWADLANDPPSRGRSVSKTQRPPARVTEVSVRRA